MADNLNLQNASGQVPGMGNAPQGPEQTNGSLDQSQVPAPAPVEPVNAAAPPAQSPDMGESSTPPSTDEFLNSILQQQPQNVPSSEPSTAPAVSPAAPPVSTEAAGAVSTEPAPPLNNPLEPQQPINEPVNAPLTPPETAMPQAAAPEPALPPVEAAPLEPAPPETAMASANRLTDSVSLDGVQSAQPPAAPQPPASDGSVSSNMFSQSPQPAGGGPKKLILIVLALIIVGGGYYAYSVFSGGATKTSTKTATNKTATAAATKTTASLVANNPNDTQRKTDLAVIADALKAYYAGSAQYPTASSMVMLNTAGNALEQALVPSYLSKLPTDPDSTKAYGYKSDGMSFTLTAVLEDATDPEAVVQSGKAIYELTSEASSTKTGTSAASSTVVTSPLAGTSSSAGSVDDAETTTATDSSLPPTLNSNF